MLSGPMSQFICGLLSVIKEAGIRPSPCSGSPKTLGLPSGRVKKTSGVISTVYANDGTIGDTKVICEFSGYDSNSEKPRQGCEALVHWMEYKMEDQGPASDI